jgi:hypothetical protein
MSAVSFQITENECSPDRGMICQLQIPVKKNRLQLVWTHHPDQLRVGQPVVLADERVPVLDFTLETSAGHREQAPKLTADLPGEVVVCDDNRWLPDSQQQAPQIQVLHWQTGEANADPRDGLQAVSDEVALASRPGHRHQVIQDPEKELPKKNVLGIRETVAFDVKLDDGSSCRVTGSVDEARREISGRASEETPAPGLAPVASGEQYVFGVDEAFDESGVANLEQMLYAIPVGEPNVARTPRALE